MEGERRFSDREVKALLGRAVELSRAVAAPPLGSRGLSLTELEHIASEAGLRPEALRQAVAELEIGRRKSGFFGALKGVETGTLASLPSEKELGRLLMDLPDIAGSAGNGAAVEDGLIWRSDGASTMTNGRSMRVEIRQTVEGASVDARFDITSAAGGTYGGIVGGFGPGLGFALAVPLGLVVLHSPLLAVLLGLAGLVGAFGIARAVIAAMETGARKRCRALIEAILSRFGPRGGDAPPT
jgi:hypothetical protein